MAGGLPFDDDEDDFTLPIGRAATGPPPAPSSTPVVSKNMFGIGAEEEEDFFNDFAIDEDDDDDLSPMQPQKGSALSHSVQTQDGSIDWGKGHLIDEVHAQKQPPAAVPPLPPKAPRSGGKPPLHPLPTITKGLSAAALHASEHSANTNMCIPAEHTEGAPPSTPVVSTPSAHHPAAVQPSETPPDHDRALPNSTPDQPHKLGHQNAECSHATGHAGGFATKTLENEFKSERGRADEQPEALPQAISSTEPNELLSNHSCMAAPLPDAATGTQPRTEVNDSTEAARDIPDLTEAAESVPQALTERSKQQPQGQVAVSDQKMPDELITVNKGAAGQGKCHRNEQQDPYLMPAATPVVSKIDALAQPPAGAFVHIPAAYAHAPHAAEAPAHASNFWTPTAPSALAAHDGHSSAAVGSSFPGFFPPSPQANTKMAASRETSAPAAVGAGTEGKKRGSEESNAQVPSAHEQVARPCSSPLVLKAISHPNPVPPVTAAADAAAAVPALVPPAARTPAPVGSIPTTTEAVTLARPVALITATNPGGSNGEHTETSNAGTETRSPSPLPSTPAAAAAAAAAAAVSGEAQETLDLSPISFASQEECFSSAAKVAYYVVAPTPASIHTGPAGLVPAFNSGGSAPSAAAAAPPSPSRTHVNQAPAPIPNSQPLPAQFVQHAQSSIPCTKPGGTRHAAATASAPTSAPASATGGLVASDAVVLANGTGLPDEVSQPEPRSGGRAKGSKSSGVDDTAKIGRPAARLTQASASHLPTAACTPQVQSGGAPAHPPAAHIPPSCHLPSGNAHQPQIAHHPSSYQPVAPDKRAMTGSGASRAPNATVGPVVGEATEQNNWGLSGNKGLSGMREFSSSLSKLETMLLRAQELQLKVLDARAQSAMLSNKLVRLDNPMQRARIQKASKHYAAAKDIDLHQPCLVLED